MLDLKIFIGGQNVLASGTVTSIGDRTIAFKPLPAPSEEYTIELVFMTDVLANEMSLNFEAVPPLLFRIVSKNLNTTTWNSTKDPLYVANHSGERSCLILLHV
jgi:hypothetical protein